MDQTTNKPWYKKKRTWLGAIILLVIIVAVASPKDEPSKVSDSKNQSSTSQQQTTFNPGDVIAFDGKEVTVSPAERNWNSGNQFITPNSGNEFVKVQVTIENKSSSEASYNTFDWKIRNSNGVIKDVSSTTYSIDNGLESGELAMGGKVSGFLVFEVPEGDQGLVLQYSPSFWSDKKIEIKL